MADTDDDVTLSGATDTFTAASVYVGGKHYQPIFIADSSTPSRRLTVNSSGEITANLGATDNAVLDSAVALLTTIDADTGSVAGCVGGTELQVDIVGALPAGTAAIGKLAANSGVDIGDVDVTSISAGSNLIGDVALQGRTSGGLSMFSSIDIDESEEEVKGSAGQLYTVSAFNTTAAPLYLKFYNGTAAGIAVGTDTPVITFVVPGNADTDGAGFIFTTAVGLAFGTGITVACTTGVAVADTGAPGANACIVNVGYK